MTKILITDDAAFMRMLIKDTLQKHGYTDIIEASDGKEACEKYESENPDLVFISYAKNTRDFSHGMNWHA